MIEKIKSDILKLCKNKDWNWRLHIESVVKYSKILAKKLEADVEICEISAWLHDIIKIRDNQRELHHVKGSEEAVKILNEYHYPQDKIEKIRHCILTHSSDKNYPPKSKEAKILASADALSHIDNFLALTYVVYYLKKCSVNEGKDWLIKKYKACNDKLELVPEAKKIAKQKYESIKMILDEQY